MILWQNQYLQKRKARHQTRLKSRFALYKNRKKSISAASVTERRNILETFMQERFVVHGGSLDPHSIGQSCYTIDLQANGVWYRIMIDCGSEIDPDDDCEPEKLGPDFSLLDDGKPVDFVIFTHYHYDHIGFIAQLRAMDRQRISRGKQPFLSLDCKFVMSPQAAATLPIILEEGERKERHIVFDTAYVLNRIRVIPQPGEFELAPGLTIFCKESGHIPGALSIAIRTSRGDIVLITGDICWHDQPVVKGAPSFLEWPQKWLPNQILATDLTYGSRRGTSFDSERDRLIARVTTAFREEQKDVFIATLGLRGPNIVSWLTHAGIPVWLDGIIPRIYEIFRKNRWSERDCELPPLEANKLVHIVQNSGHRKQLLETPGPRVFITTGGMMDYGPIVTYRNARLSDKNACFFATSFLPPSTDGYRLLQLARQRAEHPNRLYVFDPRHSSVEAPIPFLADFDRFSVGSHGSADEFWQYILDLAYVRSSNDLGPIKRLSLTHGTPETKTALTFRFAPFVQEIIRGERNTVLSLAA